MNKKVIKWGVLGVILALLITCGVRSCVTNEENTEDLTIIEDNLVVVEPLDLEPEPTVEPVNEEVEVVNIVEELPQTVMIPIKVELPTKTIIEYVEVPVESLDTLEITPIELVEEDKPIVTVEEPIELEEEPEVTMSCPPEYEDNGIISGGSIVVGAFNDLGDGGTIVYATPVLKLNIYSPDGFGLGGYIYTGIGLAETQSLLVSGLIGVSYGLELESITFLTTGGLYGTHMQYLRDGEFNNVNSLGLGLDIRALFPFNVRRNNWSVSIGIASGFFGDPNGTLTLGFSIK